jgi:hypothetical protein
MMGRGGGAVCIVLGTQGTPVSPVGVVLLACNQNISADTECAHTFTQVTCRAGDAAVSQWLGRQGGGGVSSPCKVLNIFFWRGGCYK